MICGQITLKPLELTLKMIILTVIFLPVLRIKSRFCWFSSVINQWPFCEPLRYEEVAIVCSKLKSGISGVQRDHHCGNSSVISDVFNKFFFMRFFKDRCYFTPVTLFSALCKIYEMVLPNRLESYAKQKGLFSDMQFGFKERV